jgi:hypothetical protein
MNKVLLLVLTIGAALLVWGIWTIIIAGKTQPQEFFLGSVIATIGMVVTVFSAWGLIEEYNKQNV